MAFSDSQYDELMNIYYKNQIENRALENDRKKEIYDKIPRIQEIDNLIASSSINAVRSRLKQGTNAMEDVQQQNGKLIAEKQQLLETNGYPADYLQPGWQCILQLFQTGGYFSSLSAIHSGSHFTDREF